MKSEQDIINKLMISKKIMEKHNEIGRGGIPQQTNINREQVEEFQPVKANYNIPQEFLNESDVKIQSSVSQGTTEERIKNSRLPDEIKRLMMEHPIDQPTMGGSATLSNELIEKASRLMGTNQNSTVSQTPRAIQKQQTTNASIDYSEIRDIVKETVEDVLKENGLLVESTTRSNEIFKFRVGNHIFEGKLTNIKKINK
jgi:hypothetical protein